MGIVERMIRPQASRSTQSWSSDDDRWYYPGGSFYGGFPTSEAGIPVTSDTAMRLITVQNCVRMRATTLARLPCHVMAKKGKMKERAIDFYLYEMLHDQPNDWMTAPEFWAMAEAHVCLRGNFYAYKLGLSGRPLKGLIPLKADTVEEVIQNEDYSLTYNVRIGGKNRSYPNAEGVGTSGTTTVEIPQDKIMHIRGLTLNGYMGVNPIEYARETVGLNMASVRFLSRYFGKGLHPSAVIKHPLPLNNQAYTNRRDALKERYEGLGKSHEFMLIDENMDISFPEIKLVDAQYIEQMKLSDAQICGLFRVPLMLVNGGDKEPTYASAEQFMLFYQMFSIDAPIYEAAIRRDLLTFEERKKYYAKFSMEGLLRGSMENRAKFYQTMVNAEIFSPNECRDLEDMNPYDGGDEYKTRTSTVRNQDQSKGDKK